ncbi:MAG TPA: hypothetical protein DCS43_16805 [Verrucomicrobia bacterium]|nr:hypothetical protein [Verrucomicrobiota bacterium]
MHNSIKPQQRPLFRPVAWLGLLLAMVPRLACPATDTAPSATPAAARIVALSPSLTKQLYLLGLAKQVVGITTYCPQPPDDLPVIEPVGSVVDPSTERIVRLQPDLDVATPLANRKRMDTLRGLGITVAEFRAARSFDEVCTQFLELGRLTGVTTSAERMVADAKARVQTLRARVAGHTRPRVFIQIGAKPLSTAGKDSFLNDLIDMAGGVNIADDTTFRVYSREAVLAANPDCILIVTMGMTGPDEKQKWGQYKHLAAAANQRIFMIDSALVCSPTPLDFADALVIITGLLHPEADASEGPK